MNRKLVAGGTLVVLAGAAVVIVLVMRHGGHRHPHHNTSSVHAGGIDTSDTSVSFEAMLNAPEAATPCETAFAAIEAEQSASKLRGGASIFKWVAPKPDFLAACQALSVPEQKCMMPRYRRDHDEECRRAVPDAVVLKKMIVGMPVPEPTGGP